MRRPLLLPLIVLLSACGGDGVLLRGSLREDVLRALGDSLFVQVEGGERVPVRGGSFELTDVPAGAVRLLVGSGEDAASMDLREIPEGAELGLEGIRVDRESGLAFPSDLRIEGGKTVLVNGIRRAPPEALPATVATEGVVLAASPAGDALLFRPADPSLPDLRVVVPAAAETTTEDGDPVSPEGVEDGDSIRLEGGTEGAYVVARRLVLPRRAAVREARRGERGDEVRPRERREGEPREERPSARSESRSREAEAPAPRAREDRGGGRDDAPGRGRGKGRGKEKGGGKGKGKGKS